MPYLRCTNPPADFDYLNNLREKYTLQLFTFYFEQDYVINIMVKT